jgi:hypothetical protein
MLSQTEPQFQSDYGEPLLPPKRSPDWRTIRAWFYRRFPSWKGNCFAKKLAGYERRWGLEHRAFTKRGFFQVFRQKVLAKIPAGVFFEIQAGHGLVGSLGLWLERESPPWEVWAWEHRKIPAMRFADHRPLTRLILARKTEWIASPPTTSVIGVTLRGAREASGLCRAIRNRRIRPRFVGIWNPRRHPVWYRRMKREGYHLALVYDRTEFYIGS